MEIREFRPSEFSALEKHWRVLENGRDMTAFQQYGWYKIINGSYREEKAKRIFRKWLYLLVTDNEKPLMIAPVQLVRAGIYFKGAGIRRGVYIIGRRTYSDYLNFIYKSFEPEAFNMITDYLKRRYHTSFYQLEQVLKATELYSHIHSSYRAESHEIENVSVFLPESFEQYSKMLSKSSRQNIRTAINRAAKNGLNFKYEFTDNIDDGMIETFTEMRRERIRQKNEADLGGLPATHRIYLRLRELISSRFSVGHDVLKENYRPWCLLIKEKNTVAGFFFGIRSKSCLYVMLVGVNDEFSWYSPNISNMYLFIKGLYEKGSDEIKQIDFTKGAEKYKFDLGGMLKPSATVSFFLSDRTQ